LAAGAFFEAAGDAGFAVGALRDVAVTLAAGGFAVAAARADGVAVFFAAAADAALLERLPPEPDFAAMTRPPLALTGPSRGAESEG
jgi:hypothetical protein